MKDQLIFNTASADTIADSDSVGAYIRASDGTLITKTTDGSREALDVFTELGQAEDSAHSSGDIGVMGLAVRQDTAGSLVDADGDYTPLQVDSTGALRVNASVNIDAASEKDEDAAHSSGDTGEYVLAVRADARPTDANTSADGDYASFFVNGSGELYVKDTDAAALLTTIDADTGAIATSVASIDSDTTTIATNTGTTATNTGTIAGDTTSIDASITALSQDEDAAHSSGDAGIMGLAVRNDTLASLVDTDGDYAPLQVSAAGALYVNVAEGSITTSDAALANTALANSAVSVTTTATDLVATDLSNRKYLSIYNQGNRKIYIGDSSVTTGNGFPLSPGSYLEMRAGAAQDVHAIAPGGSQDVRILELS